jgi:glycosyltransferase involved in cell wall biosynthesis
MKKLAIITSHPIQYHAPWFRLLSEETLISSKVFYLWDAGVNRTLDPGFRQAIQWDIPLLAGYDSEFVPNISKKPGTSHFGGLRNPSLLESVKAYVPDAVLMMGYNYASLMHFIWHWQKRDTPLLFRGDSHRLVNKKSVKEWARRKFISSIYQSFAGFLYVGKANYEYFRYHGIQEDRLFFAPHAVDNDRFFAQHEVSQQAALWKEELRIPKEHAVILFAGKFEAKKRPLDLLEAFLKADIENVILLFVGSGPMEQLMRTASKNHPNVRFASFQNQSLMPRTYAIADLFVLPSYGPAETWGLAINEAMCMSCPVIASTHVGCAQDLIHPGENGLIFPAGDIDAFTETLREAFSDMDRLKTWGEKSRRIIEDYSYAQTTRGLINALTQR